MTIRCIYAVAPMFPPADQEPTAQRVQIGTVWVDYIGATPTQADVDAVLSPSTDSIDTASLNAALTASGSVVRALGLVMFAEINKLRIKNGDPAYTMAQFLAALKAQMR